MIDCATKADLRDLEQRLELWFERMEHQIDGIVVRLGSLVVIFAGLLFGALHLWPTH
jgi:hypothetical protein